MIKAENISKRFGNTSAVDDISFEVKEGETLVLLGTSGCGKTTTLRMVNRLIASTAGKIFFRGEDISEIPPSQLRRKIGYVIQKVGLFPHYTVKENISVVPRLLGWSVEKTTERGRELLKKLHLDPAEYEDKYPSQLSGGQQQRVGLARALISDPETILMDEPLGALDPITRKSIRKEFKELEELRKKAGILVTHDIAEAFDLGDNICLMDKGKIIDRGTPKELLFESDHPFTANFLEGQRFQLTLQVLKVKDIMHNIDLKEGEPEEFIEASLTLEDVFESFRNIKIGLEGKKGKYFEAEQIIKALEK